MFALGITEIMYFNIKNMVVQGFLQVGVCGHMYVHICLGHLVNRSLGHVVRTNDDNVSFPLHEVQQQSMIIHATELEEIYILYV